MFNFTFVKLLDKATYYIQQFYLYNFVLVQGDFSKPSKLKMFFQWQDVFVMVVENKSAANTRFPVIAYV